MNNFGFNGLNNDNPLAQLLKQYVPQQPESAPSAPESPRTTTGGIMVFEINSKSDIEYIEPDKSGRRQIYLCDNENKVYTSRYNHVRRDMDYRVYIDEGEISLFKKNDTDADMSQIAEALGAVVNELKTMRNEIQELKNTELVKTKPDRQPDGKFKKKDEV